MTRQEWNRRMRSVWPGGMSPINWRTGPFETMIAIQGSDLEITDELDWTLSIHRRMERQVLRKMIPEQYS